MGVATLSGFVSTWSPAYSSTVARVERRNIGQGGNQLLAAAPQGTQALWAGSVLAEVVTQVVSGPFYYLAQLFRFLFNPLVAYPLSLLSCAVKERFYESSIQVKTPAQTKYFARGLEVPGEHLGTVSIMVEGEERLFHLSENITYMMNQTVEIPERGKRFWFRRLEVGEAFDENCREIELNGQVERVRLEWEYRPGSYVEMQFGDRTQYFSLGQEVDEQIPGTVFVPDPGFQHVGTYYLIGEELAEETPDCIKVEMKEQDLHYQTGIEVDEPVDGGRSFVIDGERHYYRSAKFIKDPYWGISGWINKVSESLHLPPLLPTRLGKFSVEVLEMISEHMSNVVRAVLFASGVALAWYGFYGMALGTIAAVSYEFLDHDIGVIPTEVSLFMERWMPTISMCGLLIVGSLTSQIMAGISLVLMVPEVNLYIHQVVAKVTRQTLLGISDQIAEWFFQGRRREHFQEFVEAAKNHPILEECDAPLVQRKVMGRPEIEAILERDADTFELNPPHLTKSQEVRLALEENRSFNVLMDLWDRAGARWTEEATFNRLVRRLVDDKRFILFVKERFPEAKRFHYEENWRLTQEENRQQYALQEREHREQFVAWIDILAREKGQNQREFVADWIRCQLQFYVNKLSGNRPIEGEQRLLSEAIEQTAQILPFLLREDAAQVDIEDALVKLAIEGGDYCSLAMRRASKEVLDGFTEPLREEALRELGPQAAFEAEVFLQLQRARLRILNGFYARVMSRFDTEELKDTAEDIHLYQMTTQALKRSFYPLSAHDMQNFSITDLAFKETMFMPAEVELYQRYLASIPDVMREVGIDPRNLMHNKVLEYLRTWVQESQVLTPQDKAHLLNGSLSNGMDNLADFDNYPKWNCLFLTVLGVIRPKRAA